MVFKSQQQHTGHLHNPEDSTQPKVELEVPDDESISKATKAYLNPKTKASTSSSSSNPYAHISNYSHEATTVPPYVLYGIANSNKPQDSRKGYDNTNHIGQTVQDPFISSLNNNWGTFFQTVNSTPAYAEGVLNHDSEALKNLPALSGKWGGDERLKRYLNHPESHTDSNLSEKKWYQRNGGAGTSDVSSDDNDYSKTRSKAGYWMSTDRRSEWKPTLKRLFLYNNYIPLFFRIFIIALSIIALALSCDIFRLSRKTVRYTNDQTGTITQQPSTIMAICVQSIAMAYLIYITYDEFNAKPLGIRNPLAKIRLILLDLLFIIFSSANLSLAFNTLYDGRWVCAIDQYSRYPKVDSICSEQKALSAFLFLVLVMWVSTFTISILRVIEKVSSPGL